MKYLRDGIITIKDRIKDDSINQDASDQETTPISKDSSSQAPPNMSLNSAVEDSYQSDLEEVLDKRIWKRLKKGDLDALGELYDLYVDELFSYGMGQVSNKTRVMDGIHDLFVDLYKYRSNLSVPINVKYYLLKSLKRKIYRKQSATKSINIEDFLETRSFDPALSREEEIINAERADERKGKLKTALTLLTKRQQKALYLRYTENMEYHEIAESMNISMASSRTLVYRAILVLRKHCVSLVVMSFNLFS